MNLLEFQTVQELLVGMLKEHTVRVTCHRLVCGADAILFSFLRGLRTRLLNMVGNTGHVLIRTAVSALTWRLCYRKRGKRLSGNYHR